MKTITEDRRNKEIRYSLILMDMGNWERIGQGIWRVRVRVFPNWRWGTVIVRLKFMIVIKIIDSLKATKNYPLNQIIKLALHLI